MVAVIYFVVLFPLTLMAQGVEHRSPEPMTGAPACPPIPTACR